MYSIRFIPAATFSYALTHPAQPDYHTSGTGTANTELALDHTLATLRDVGLAEMLAAVLNGPSPDPLDRFRFQKTAERLPDIEAIEIKGRANIQLRVGRDVVGYAVRADGRPAVREAETVAGAKASAVRLIDDHRAVWWPEVAASGMDKAIMVDAIDAEAVAKAGPWRWTGDDIVNAHGARLVDLLVEPVAEEEEALKTGPVWDFRRARLGRRSILQPVTLQLSPVLAARLKAMRPAEIAAAVER